MVAEEKIKKEDFIKWLKNYLVDVEWTDSVENRVRYMLAKVETIVEVPVRVTKIVKQEVYVPVPTLQSGQEKIPLEDIADEFCRKHNTTIQRLRSPIKREPETKLREMFIAAALAQYSYSSPELGKFLHRNHSTILDYKRKILGLPTKQKARAAKRKEKNIV
jgi:chromosomal replication initiation ATPase DnaA